MLNYFLGRWEFTLYVDSPRTGQRTYERLFDVGNHLRFTETFDGSKTTVAGLFGWDDQRNKYYEIATANIMDTVEISFGILSADQKSIRFEDDKSRHDLIIIDDDHYNAHTYLLTKEGWQESFSAEFIRDKTSALHG